VEKMPLKRPLQMLAVLLLTTGLACDKYEGNKKMGAAERMQMSKNIATLLKTDKPIERQSPFVKRDFDPYLGGEWIGDAVSYGPYRRGQAPGKKGPSEAEILQDLQLIQKTWQLIRVYGADTDSERILKVIDEHKLPIKVMLGVWLENESKNKARRQENIEQVVMAIKLANTYQQHLAAVSVGNESQVYWSWHRMDREKLIRYIRAVRKHTDVPVTCADDYNFWNKAESKAVTAEIDFIVCHMYAMWNSQTLAKAIPWTDSVYTDISKRYPEHEIVLGETGWATTYNPAAKGPGEQGTLIKGEVSIAAQEKFLLQLHDWVQRRRVSTFLFEAFDEPWKGGGEASGANEVEKHWGVYYENRQPKASFVNYLKKIAAPVE
jgi:exo-beta-1,3-glucanase (GH17 family)